MRLIAPIASLALAAALLAGCAGRGAFDPNRCYVASGCADGRANGESWAQPRPMPIQRPAAVTPAITGRTAATTSRSPTPRPAAAPRAPASAAAGAAPNGCVIVPENPDDLNSRYRVVCVK